MKRRGITKKVTAFVLAAAMLLSLGGCASGDKKESGTTPGAQSTPAPSLTEAADKENTPDAGTVNADEPAWKRDTSPVDLTWFIGASWYANEWGESLVSKHITEKTGVNLEFVVPTADANEELSLMMVGDDLPDIISLGSWEVNFTKLYEDGYVYALNELADQYDPYFYNVVDGAVINWHTKDDGNLYCIPNDAFGESQMRETGMTAASQTFLVRKDLYADMGSPDMTTPEGFLAALRTLKEKFSTYKGQEITPFYAQGGSGYGLSTYLQNFLAVPYEENGQIYDRLTNEDYITWLKMFRQAYDEGLIGVDYLVDSDQQVEEKSNTARYFCMLREWNGMLAANTIISQSENPDSYYIAVDGPSNSAKDAPIINPGSLDGWMPVFISKNCKNPERAIAFLTYLNSEEGQRDMFLGVEGETYDTVDNKPVMKQKFIDMMGSDPDSFANVYGLGDTYWMMRNNVIVNQWRPESAEYIKQMSDWANHHADLSAGIYNGLEPTGDSDAAIASTKISQKWEEVLPELITAPSEEKFDEIFKSFLDTREGYGYNLVVDYKQALLQARLAKLAD